MYTKLHKKNIAIILIAILATIITFNVTTNAKSNKNTPYSTNSKNFKNNINGFFTADTWYRPKMINENGTHWRKSKSNEYRPLLTVWWPNKDIKKSYITYMIDNGLSEDISSSNDKSLNNESKIIHKNIEKKIHKTKSTKWLNKLIKNFVNNQSIWNVNSENKTSYNLENGLQGGFLRYGNNKLTPYSNSSYRLFNRNGFNQSGNGDRRGSELLLANDIDNSNPTVQSEQLNLMYYLTHFGSITQKNKNANFDSLRIDATLDIDADLFDIVSNYYKKVYKSNKNEYSANNRLSLSEASNDLLKDDDRLKISPLGPDIKNVITDKTNKRGNLEDLAKDDINTPTYSYLNSHDSSDASVNLGGIIPRPLDEKISRKKKNYIINKKKTEYENDLKKTNKNITKYNVPSAYALILSNKNTVPRIYYGDLFLDTESFMNKKTLYYNSITSLMKNRKKYVSGSQHKEVQYVNGSDDMKPMSSDSSTYRGILKSIRNGKNRTQGQAVILGNNPSLKMSDNDKIKVSMGPKHKNQRFRPTLKSTNNGINIYDSDSSVNKNDIKTTDKNGDFYLTKSDIKCVNNPQVSGYLSTWVPMGAKQNQDARTKSSKKRVLKDKMIYKGAALDSNLILEGFSSYQKSEKNPSTYRKIAKNAKLFNQLGITYYEFPPTYRSDKSDVFEDTTYENGYGIKDRYDYGFKTPTKYGTAKELTNAISSLHKNNVKAMADYVPNQIYNLPNKEVVNTTRTNWWGEYIGNGAMKNKLYATNSKGSGKDYQAKFGGKYLKELKKKYPSIFKQKQISTGKTIDSSGKRIKTWSAKYLNGTNIQGRGSDYVLSNNSNGKYYKVGKNQYLPKNLLK